jgi:excisionase family DNA binding protein
MEPTPLLVSVEEAARLLGMKSRSVMYLLQSGALKRQKIGRRTLIQRSQVVAYASRSHPGRIRPISSVVAA